MARWYRFYCRLSRKLGFRATLYCITGVLVALIARVAGPYIPEAFSRHVGAEAVDAILAIIASSMLAVTTFSLTTMVSAIAAASSSATPRVSSLVIEDTTAQRALSTFLGAFLFSLVGLIALKTNFYGPGGRLVLFVATLVVIALIIFTLLRWIAHLSRLGRLGETIQRVEAAAIESMRDYRTAPTLGAAAFTTPPAGGRPVHSQAIGYIEHLDVPLLASVADKASVDIYMMMRPGGFCVPGRPVAYVLPRPPAKEGDPSQPDKAPAVDDSALDEQVNAALAIQEERSFDQDPRFGLIVLCEIGSRALSTAINDPGTIIHVLGVLVRVLSHATPLPDDESPEVAYPHVHLPPHRIEDFFDDAFTPLARDGAGLLEVGLKLQKSLAALAAMHPAFREPAVAWSRSSLDRAMHAMAYDGDRQRLARAALCNHDVNFDRPRDDGPTRTMLA